MSAVISGKAFDQGMDGWAEQQRSPWGKLRYRVGAANLEPYLGKRPLTILDLGGGNGYDALWLARAGHTVTVFDFSEEMLAQGQQLVQEASLTNLVSFQLGDVTEVGGLFENGRFDLILCHNVLQYVPDATAVLQTLYTLLKPEGQLSLIITNPHAETLVKALRELDPAQALESVGKPTHYVPTFNVTIQRYTDTELKQILAASGFAVQKQYGIRCINDFMPNNDIKHDLDFYQQLEALEMALRDKYPYYLLARFYHFIATK